MKRRTIVSIILCAVFLILSVSFYALGCYISIGGHPGLDGYVFAPAAIKKVSVDKDIVVSVYPTGAVRPHGFDEDHPLKINLNDIDKGWIINKFDGKCRVLFLIKNANMEDIWGDYISEHYYYADLVPRERLRVLDIAAKQRDDPTNPFETHPDFLTCCIHEEMLRYNLPRIGGMICVATNVIFILIVMLVNFVISRFSRKGT